MEGTTRLAVSGELARSLLTTTGRCLSVTGCRATQPPSARYLLSGCTARHWAPRMSSSLQRAGQLSIIRAKKGAQVKRG